MPHRFSKATALTPSASTSFPFNPLENVCVYVLGDVVVRGDVFRVGFFAVDEINLGDENDDEDAVAATLIPDEEENAAFQTWLLSANRGEEDEDDDALSLSLVLNEDDVVSSLNRNLARDEGETKVAFIAEAGKAGGGRRGDVESGRSTMVESEKGGRSPGLASDEDLGEVCAALFASFTR